MGSLQWTLPEVALLEHCFQVIVKFGMKVFVEGGEKPSVKGWEPTTNSPCLWQVRNWTQSTAVGGEHSHHYAIPTPQPMQSMFNHLKWFGMIVRIFSFFFFNGLLFSCFNQVYQPLFWLQFSMFHLHLEEHGGLLDGPLRQTLHLDVPEEVNLISFSVIHTQNEPKLYLAWTCKERKVFNAQLFFPEEMFSWTGKVYIWKVGSNTKRTVKLQLE